MFTGTLSIRLRVLLPFETLAVALPFLGLLDFETDRSPGYSDADRVAGFTTAGG